MSISEISRYFVGEPNLVAIVSDDNLATVTASGYLTGTAIAANIELLQNGEFQWQDTDLVLMYYSGGIGFFTRDATNNTFVAVPAASGLSNTLLSARMLVGNGSNLATAVAMSGDVALTNTGVTTIQPATVTLAKLAAGVAPSHVVKYAGQPTTVGGAAAEAFTVTGAAATDLAYVQIVNNGTSNVTVLQAVVTLNTLTVTFSADPVADTIFNYQLLRAAV